MIHNETVKKLFETLSDEAQISIIEQLRTIAAENQQNTTDLVTAVYNKLNVVEKADNPFEIKAVDDALDELLYKFENDPEEYTELYCNATGVLALERENAFRIGFIQGVQAVKQITELAGGNGENNKKFDRLCAV